MVSNTSQILHTTWGWDRQKNLPPLNRLPIDMLVALYQSGMTVPEGSVDVKGLGLSGVVTGDCLRGAAEATP